MRFIKWLYLVCVFMPMASHWHTDHATKANFCVTPTSLSAHTLASANLYATSQFIDIELLEEIEEDNETQTEVNAAHFLKRSSDILFYIAFVRSTSQRLFFQAPSLPYKSKQSYLQVFRI